MGRSYHEDNGSFRPDLMDVFDHVDVGLVEVVRGDLIRRSMVISAHLEDD